jgi:hypothetical protein
MEKRLKWSLTVYCSRTLAFRYYFATLCTGLLASCTFYLPTSGGSGCFGWGCPGGATRNLENASDGSFLIIFNNFTRFESSVKPSVDNFLHRLRANPQDPSLTRHIDDFFQPGRRILGQEFQFEPKIEFTVQPSTATINVSISQPNWREITKFDPAFSRFLPLIRPSASEGIEAIRWRMEVTSGIAATDETTIRYVSVLKIFLEKKIASTGNFIRIPTPSEDSRQSFANRINSALLADYRELFEKSYGLRVKR